MINILTQLQAEPTLDGTSWYLSWPDGSHFDGQFYKRAQDAKQAKTMLLKSFT